MQKIFYGEINDFTFREIWQTVNGKWEVRDYSVEEPRRLLKVKRGLPEKLFNLDAYGRPRDFSKDFH